MSNYFSSIGDFASEAIGSVGDFASNADYSFNAADTGNFFSTAADYAGNAFSWIGDYPEVANVLGGVAVGAGAAYSAGQDREQRARDNRLNREMEANLQQQRIDSQKIVPGSGANNYGSYQGAVTRGLISNGMIAGDEEPS
jgi:hypothetical protein